MVKMVIMVMVIMVKLVIMVMVGVRNHEKYLIVRSCTNSCAIKMLFVHDRARIVHEKNRATKKIVQNRANIKS